MASFFHNKTYMSELLTGVFSQLQKHPASTAIANCHLGLLYAKNGSSMSKQAVMRSFETAAREGNRFAQFLLGVCLFEGMAGPTKRRTGISLIDSSAYLGNEPAALNYMGGLYARGVWHLGIKQSPAQAFTAFKAAADLGDKRGLRNTGNCLLKGFGVERNMNYGLNLLLVAAKKGDAQANQMLCNLQAQARRNAHREPARAGIPGQSTLALADQATQPSFLLNNLAGSARPENERVISIVEETARRKMKARGSQQITNRHLP